MSLTLLWAPYLKNLAQSCICPFCFKCYTSYIFISKLKISNSFKTENNQLKKFERSQSSQFTKFCIGKISYNVKFQLCWERKLKPASILCCFWCFTRLLIQLLTQCVFYRKLIVLKESNSNGVVKIFFTRFCFFLICT